MLSRVAESLHWTARYIERAELMSRVVHVNFHELLDSDQSDHAQAWRRLLRLGGVEELFSEHHDEYTAQTVGEFMLWGPENPNAVTTCVARARENARGIRDQISTEMWEELNRLHLYLASSRRSGVVHAQHQLFVRVRQGSQGFGGVMRATLPRGEGYEMLRLGTHIERADVTARILAVESPTLVSLPLQSPEEAVRLTTVLKSCGALEAFRKAGGPLLATPRVLEYLLLDRACPRTVLFCLEACRRSIESIAGPSDRPERTVGRLASELSFLDMSELQAHGLAELLARVLEGIASAGDEIASAFFTTRVFVPGAYAQAQAQQQ